MIAGSVKLNVQILGNADPAIGPGKAMVLEAIDRTGSISAAGRDLGMSYRRIWLLVDSLNRGWAAKVIETREGEGSKRGARLTPFGRRMLETYRMIEARMMAAAAGADMDWLLSQIPESPTPPA